ncbi:Hypothetical protein NTJ_04252 [Nesidiocoris tenuis]|uniref:Uncharacterized protein n=1 Tax=Nesidiocoris tenuis TaxID=355587 RepID=A0ABN7AJ97_9HEMI|nr:Hypothetical protein NTJ_04252 [Nesidiocoris tenuis]
MNRRWPIEQFNGRPRRNFIARLCVSAEDVFGVPQKRLRLPAFIFFFFCRETETRRLGVGAIRCGDAALFHKVNSMHTLQMK